MRSHVYIRAAEKLNQLGHKERARRLVRHAHKIEMSEGAPKVTFDVDGKKVTAAVFASEFSIVPDWEPGLRLDITPTDPSYMEEWLDSDVGDGLNLVVNWEDKNGLVMWLDLWGEQKHVKCRCADRASANKLRDIIEEALAFHEGVETEALAVMRAQKPTANHLY